VVIGVIARPGQSAVVEEFFELFKTPWEFYRAGSPYDVLIAAAGELPPTATAPLIVLHGPALDRTDTTRNILDKGSHADIVVRWGDSALPIYGKTRTFGEWLRHRPCVFSDAGAVGIRSTGPPRFIRLGYDVFDQVRLLLEHGQPVEHAGIPTLDLHIEMLRTWIVEAGLPLLEVPPVPAGYGFGVCLTHDIDFIGIRRHLFDHSMWGFLYRSTLGAVKDLFRGRISIGRAARMWKAAATLPLVYLRWAHDFWEPFSWYLHVEEGLPSTYYLIPFKGRQGDRVPARDPSRRASKYDVDDLRAWALALQSRGCELGVHGIDAWHNVHSGATELARIKSIADGHAVGIRIHWLLRDSDTASILDQSGYGYDSTCGYNETVGYRNGTTQVFRPLSAMQLLELPLHIQDGALFFPEKLNLTEPAARARCSELVRHSQRVGGVLTVLWHDRSHGPERFWGGFYIRLVNELKASGAWFSTAAQAVDWFRRRRSVRFERIETASGEGLRVRCEADDVQPAFTMRISRFDGNGTAVDDTPWTGASVEFDSELWPVREPFTQGIESARHVWLNSSCQLSAS